jgi:hypothetical protein
MRKTSGDAPDSHNAAEMIAHAFRKLLSARTGDARADAHLVLTSSHATPKGIKRLNSGGAVVKPGRDALLDADFGLPLGEKVLANEVLTGLIGPCILLTFTNALHAVDSIRVTHDPRRAWVNTPGGPILFDATLVRRSATGDTELDRAGNEARAAKECRIKVKWRRP